MAAGPVGELRERAAELAFQAGNVGAIADALEPFHITAISFLCELPLKKTAA
jgi:hypothetical protein